MKCPIFLEHIEGINLFYLGYGFAFFLDDSKPETLAGLDVFLEKPQKAHEFFNALPKTTVTQGLLKNLRRLYLETVPASQRVEGIF